METVAIAIASKEVLDKVNVYPTYITFRCVNCGHVWGVNTEWSQNHTLSNNDLVCRKCATDTEADTL